MKKGNKLTEIRKSYKKKIRSVKSNISTNYNMKPGKAVTEIWGELGKGPCIRFARDASSPPAGERCLITADG